MMKGFLVIFFLFSALMAMNVPYSTTPVTESANMITGMVRTDPPDQNPIPLDTKAYVWHDGEYFYVRVISEIDENFTRGVNATHDDVQNSDYVRIQFRTMEAAQFAYYMAVYPRGTLYDGVRREGKSLEKSWDSHFEGTSVYDNHTWTVDIRIPFEDLRFSGEPPYQWGINVARRIESTRCSYGFPYVSGQMSDEEYFAAMVPLEIAEPVKEPRLYQIVPYFYRSYDLVNETYTFDPDHVGATLVYRPTTVSSVKLAFNPDFSDVPVDEERDSSNDKYPPNLAENRLFFTEDVNAFGLPNGLFYSRNLMQPRYALKYTSSSPDWVIGVLNAVDRETREDSLIINPADMFSIVSVKPMGETWEFLVSALHRFNHDEKTENLVLYSKPKYRFSRQGSFSLSYAFSSDKADTLKTEGHSESASFFCEYDNWNLNTSLSHVSNRFMPGMGSGYARIEKGYVLGEMSLGKPFVFTDSFVYYLTFDLNLSQKRESEDWSDIRTENKNVSFEMRLQPRMSANISSNWDRDRIGDNLVETNWVYANLNWYQFSWAEIYLGFGNGRQLNYSLEKTKTRTEIDTNWSGVLGAYLSYILRNSHVKWSDIHGTPGLDNEYNITNLDLEITFTNFLKLVNGVRYNDYKGSETTEHLGFFSTLRWDYNRRTRIFIGYKTSSDDVGEGLETTAESAWVKVTREF